MTNTATNAFLRMLLAFIAAVTCFTKSSERNARAAPAASSSSFQLQQFRPWGDPNGGLQTQSANALGQWNYLVSFSLNLAKDPLVLRNQESQRTSDVVRYQLGADLALALGLFSFLDLQLRIPATLYQDAVAPKDAGLVDTIRLSGFVFSDIQVGLKGQFLRQSKHFLSLGAQLFMGIPTSPAGSFNGEESVSIGAKIIASRRVSRVLLSLNIGYHYGSRSMLGNLALEHSLTYSFATNVDVVRDRFVLLADIAGRVSMPPDPSAFNAPMELYLGGKVYPLSTPSLALLFGGAVGVLPGVGSPQFRIILGVTWSPGKRSQQSTGRRDTDADGLIDELDRCPLVAGPKANKGCPWIDADGDGLKDNEDRCPRVAGPKANGGCPWIDTDGDGLHDGLDRCPKRPGPTPNRGCPHLDRDKDGIANKQDKCPDVPGLRSHQGCPKIILVRVTPKQIQILQKIHFATGSARIRALSYPILEQVLSVLAAQPHIKIRIEGHTDNVGGVSSNLRLSQSRAKAVLLYLLGRGISPHRMRSKGFGMSRPIAPNHTSTGRQINRRVEFHIARPTR